MKKILLFSRLALVGLMLLFSSGWVKGQTLLLNENFDYSTGSLTLAGTGNVSGGNWVNFSGTALYLQVTNPGLSYTGYPSSGIGNKVTTVVGSAEDAYRQFATQGVGTTTYASCLMNITTTTGLALNTSTTGDYTVSLMPSTSVTFLVARVSLRAGSVAGTFNVGLRATSTNAAAVWKLTDYPIGTPILVVISYNVVSGNLNDIANLWVNPALDGVEPSPDLTQTTATAADPVDVARITIRQGTNATPGAVDGFRVGTTWADIFPPTLTLTAPNGGEVVYAGNTYDIDWTSSYYTGTVDIEYFDGSTYTTIADNEVDDGTYSYTIPASITPGTTYKIRVSNDMSAPTISDESDADFEIKGPIYVYGNLNDAGGAWNPFAMIFDENINQWKYTYQETARTAITFLYRPTLANWDNKWSRGDVVNLNSLTDWWNNGADGTLTATIGKYYTYIFKDVAVGTNGKGYVFETTNAPVTLDAVSQAPVPASVYSPNPVVITITASAAPSPEEKIYVVYSIDDVNMNYVLAEFIGATGTATIPAQAAGTTVTFYAFSTCVANISLETEPTLAYLNYNYDEDVYKYTVQTPTTWTGATNTDWATAGNWSTGVPTSSVDAYIPTGLSNYPVISTTTTADCNNITLVGTATLNIISDATNSGSLIFGGTYIGSATAVTYQRLLSAALHPEWHLMGSPFTGQTINAAFLSTNFITGMKDYIESTDVWSVDYIVTAPDVAFSLGKGYAVNQSTTKKISTSGVVDLTGTLNNATVNVALTRSNFGWNLLSNPFTSAINATVTAHATDNLITANIAVLDPSYAALYIWDQASASYKIINNAGDGTLVQNYLQVGQGFFVKSVVGGGSFTITSAMQSHQTAIAFKSVAESTWAGITLNAETSAAKASTQMFYQDNMSRGLDVSFDAGVFKSNPEFALYSRLLEDNGVDFGLQCLPIDYENLVVPIGLDAKSGEIIKFTAASANIPEDYAVVLEDRSLNIFTELSNDGEYTVQLTADSDGVGRFFVRTAFKSTLGLGTMDLQSAFQVFTNPMESQLVIRGEATANTTARIYSITGKLVNVVNLKQAVENKVSFNENAGVYIVQIMDENGTYTQKFSWVK